MVKHTFPHKNNSPTNTTGSYMLQYDCLPSKTLFLSFHLSVPLLSVYEVSVFQVFPFLSVFDCFFFVREYFYLHRVRGVGVPEFRVPELLFRSEFRVLKKKFSLYYFPPDFGLPTSGLLVFFFFWTLYYIGSRA